MPDTIHFNQDESTIEGALGIKTFKKYISGMLSRCTFVTHAQLATLVFAAIISITIHTTQYGK
jgi:hypothetical protein